MPIVLAHREQVETFHHSFPKRRLGFPKDVAGFAEDLYLGKGSVGEFDSPLRLASFLGFCGNIGVARYEHLN